MSSAAAIRRRKRKSASHTFKTATTSPRAENSIRMLYHAELERGRSAVRIECRLAQPAPSALDRSLRFPTVHRVGTEGRFWVEVTRSQRRRGTPGICAFGVGTAKVPRTLRRTAIVDPVFRRGLKRQFSNAVIENAAPDVTVRWPAGRSDAAWPCRRGVGDRLARLRARGLPHGRASMAYKDILVYLDPAVETIERIRLAVSLAKAQGRD